MSEEIGLKQRSNNVPPLPTEQSDVGCAVVEDAPLPGLRNEPPQPAPSSQGMSLVRYLDEPLWRVRGWIQFSAILFMIHGVFCVLSLWGILVCWIPFWMGMTLLGAAKNVRVAAEMDNQDMLRTALEKIGLYFKVIGILTLISLSLAVIAFVAAALGLVGSAAMMDQAIQGMNMSQ